jgi:hypothetical protein
VGPNTFWQREPVIARALGAVAFEAEKNELKIQLRVVVENPCQSCIRVLKFGQVVSSVIRCGTAGSLRRSRESRRAVAGALAVTP